MTMRQADFAAALIDPAMPLPANLTTARGEPDALRFAVYRNNVATSLARALAAQFPVVARLVGDAFFDAMARAYLRKEPPRSPLLFSYGGSFPEFVDAFAPAASLPYLSDVARLERDLSRAYHAADRAAASVDALRFVQPERLPALRLAPHPAVSMVASQHPIGAIWHAHQVEPVAAVVERGAQAVLVTRPLMEVVATVLPPADAPFVGAILQGATLGEAAELAATDSRFDFGPALVGLFSLGAIGAILE